MPSLNLINLVFLVVGGALLATAAIKMQALVRSREWIPSRLALCVFLAALGASFIVQAPLVRTYQDYVIDNLGQLTGNGLTLVAACCALVMILYILHTPSEARRRVRARVVALVVALAAMVVLFLANPVERGDFSTSDAVHDAPPIGIVAYYMVYLVYLTSALVDLLVLVRRYASRARDPYLRMGLRLIAAGCSLGLVYSASRALLMLLALQFQRHISGWMEFAVGVLIPAVAAVLMILGVSYGQVVSALQRPVQALYQWWAYRQLGPLWEAARTTRPGLVLEVGGAGRIGLRLYRRIVEIQDAQLLINTSLHPAVRPAATAAVAAAGLTGRDAEATAEAAVFAIGLQLIDLSNRSGHVPVADTSTPSLVWPGAARLSDDDLVATARHLVRVARAYRRSPVVRRFASDVDPAGLLPR